MKNTNKRIYFLSNLNTFVTKSLFVTTSYTMNTNSSAFLNVSNPNNPLNKTVHEQCVQKFGAQSLNTTNAPEKHRKKRPPRSVRYMRKANLWTAYLLEQAGRSGSSVQVTAHIDILSEATKNIDSRSQTPIIYKWDDPALDR
jgi:hypothetical protein